MNNTQKTWNKIEGHWTDIKGTAKEKWGKLTDDELDETNGRRDQVVALLQKHYGMTLEDAEQECNHFVDHTYETKPNLFNMTDDAETAGKAGGTAGAVVGAVAGAAAGPVGAVVGAVAGGVAGAAASAGAVQVVDEHDNDGSPDEKS